MNRLLLILSLYLLVGCQEQQAVVDDDQGTHNYILTNITLSGEFNVLPEVPIVNSPQDNSISRAAADDLYAIQVYKADKATSSYDKYAYGLFDDLTKAQIELSDRQFYKFVVMVVRDGKTKVKQLFGAYSDPFTIDLKPTPLDNKFSYSASVQFTGLTLGKTHMAKDSKSYNRPEVDRYFGQVTGFQPVRGASVNVELKRVVFGIRLSCQDMTDGYVELSIDGAPSMVINFDEQSVESIFTLEGNKSNNNWIDDLYVESIVCRAKWIRELHDDQVIGPAAGRTIDVRRGYCTPIKIETTFPKFSMAITLEPEALVDGSEVTF